MTALAKSIHQNDEIITKKMGLQSKSDQTNQKRSCCQQLLFLIGDECTRLRTNCKLVVFSADDHWIAQDHHGKI